VASWTNDDIAHAWNEVEPRLPAGLNAIGVTYHGPDDDRPWVAWGSADGLGTPFGYEGWGDTPMNALHALATAYRNDVGWWTIKADDAVGRGPG
jgi:hypothetical protein